MAITRSWAREVPACAGGIGPSTSAQSPTWEKVLYKRQPFPDNHTDARQFLDQLRTNVNVVRYSFLEAVRGGAIVMTQIDLVVLYLVMFEFTQLGHWGPGMLLCASFVVAVCCLCLLLHLFPQRKNDDHWRTLVTIFTFGIAFTPIIRTLTTSISTDTIWASAILLFFCGLLSHDYGMEEAPIASTPLSVNLCLAASVFLISRVDTDFLAFLLLGLSLLLFCFWPPLRNALLAGAPNAVFLLLPLSTVASIWMLAHFNTVLALVHFLLHLFIVLFCPLLLLKMQQMKSTIHGPWDEATLRASIK